jgi:AcrR family transcriptional regulator
MRKMKKVKAKKLMGREDWLASSLPVIAKKGGRFRIEELARELGVTKGSFYWHFTDREDFVRSVARYWADSSTQSVVDKVGTVRGDAKERLFSVMEMVTRERLGRFNLAMLSWAAYEPEVATMVRKVYDQRLGFVGSLFAEMGFTGDELEMRTRSFVAYMLGHSTGIFPHETKEEMLRKLKRRFDFLTRP